LSHNQIKIINTLKNFFGPCGSVFRIKTAVTS